MIKHVDTYSIANIFSVSNNSVYKIPKYQREYTWGFNEWNQLFNDVIGNEDGYFLGSFICVSDSALGNSTLELIDGQQRFTSISLLLVSLYSKLLELKENDKLDEDEVTLVNNLRTQLANKTVIRTNGQKYNQYSSRLVLQSQNLNNDDYQALLSENKVIDFVEKPTYTGIRRIYKAFRHFSKLIDDYVSEELAKDDNAIIEDILFNLVDKFNSAVLVGIEVDSHKDAYMLFESLNHRGVPLSAIDLIKNVLIAIAENDHRADECYTKWKTALANIGDDYSVQERFFRQYYNAFRTELNKPFSNTDTGKKYPLGYLATRTTLLDIFEKLIKHNYIEFINDFQKKADLYSIIVNNSDKEKVYKNNLLELERIQGAPSYLLLLYLLTNQETLLLSDEQISSVVKCLIIFFVRRNITDYPNTRNLNKIFMDIVENIQELQSDDVVSYILNHLKSVSSENAVFVQKLNGPIYDDNDTATRFILCEIEKLHQTKETYTDLWARDSSNKYIWTIEHIFPEGNNIPDEWVDMIAGGDRSLAESYLNQFVHTIGNLTITGYNSNLSNMSFEKKKNRKSKDGTKNMGYRNGLYLNEDIVCEDVWTIEKIQARTQKLVELVAEIFAW